MIETVSAQYTGNGPFISSNKYGGSQDAFREAQARPDRRLLSLQ
jgi:hypothetical protein